MSETRSIKAIGSTIAVIGFVVLLIGLAMPATSTHTSETCVDGPTGFGQECVSGSVTTPNPFKGPLMGIGFLALLGGGGIILLSTTDQGSSAPSGRTAQGGDFADKLTERQSDSEKPLDKETHPRTTTTEGQENVHPLRSRIPSIVGYPLSLIIGAFACSIAFGILAALVGISEGIGFLVGLFSGSIWGVGAWYGLGNSQLNLTPVAFTYLLAAVGGVFIMDEILSLFGLGNTTLTGEIVFLLGIIGILVAWHYTRRKYFS